MEKHGFISIVPSKDLNSKHIIVDALYIGVKRQIMTFNALLLISLFYAILIKAIHFSLSNILGMMSGKRRRGAAGRNT